MTGYERSRAWFNFCFEHPEKIKPIHHALYHYVVELNNRLGWKEKFGLPTDVSMEVLGIKHYKTFIKALNDLVAWKFIIIIQKSKNQFTANIIALAKNAKANTKALDKALIFQSQSIVSIDKQINNETLNNEKLFQVNPIDVPNHLKKYFELALKFHEVICQNLRKKGAPIAAQEKIDFSNGITPFQMMVEQDGVTIPQIEKGIKILKSREDNFWKGVIITTEMFRKKISQLLLSAAGKTQEKESMSRMNELVQSKLERYE